MLFIYLHSVVWHCCTFHMYSIYASPIFGFIRCYLCIVLLVPESSCPFSFIVMHRCARKQCCAASPCCASVFGFYCLALHCGAVDPTHCCCCCSSCSCSCSSCSCSVVDSVALPCICSAHHNGRTMLCHGFPTPNTRHSTHVCYHVREGEGWMERAGYCAFIDVTHRSSVGLLL